MKRLGQTLNVTVEWNSFGKMRLKSAHGYAIFVPNVPDEKSRLNLMHFVNRLRRKKEKQHKSINLISLITGCERAVSHRFIQKKKKKKRVRNRNAANEVDKPQLFRFECTSTDVAAMTKEFFARFEIYFSLDCVLVV